MLPGKAFWHLELQLQTGGIPLGVLPWLEEKAVHLGLSSRGCSLGCTQGTAELLVSLELVISEAAFPSTPVSTGCCAERRKEKRVLGFSVFENAQPGLWDLSVCSEPLQRDSFCRCLFSVCGEPATVFLKAEGLSFILTLTSNKIKK